MPKKKNMEENKWNFSVSGCCDLKINPGQMESFLPDALSLE